MCDSQRPFIWMEAVACRKPRPWETRTAAGPAGTPDWKPSIAATHLGLSRDFVAGSARTLRIWSRKSGYEWQRSRRIWTSVTPGHFLLKVAFNIGLSGDRQHRRRRQILDSAAPLGTMALEPTQNAAVQIQEIVLALPQPLRDVFVLSRFGGLTNNQIAEQLDISPKTVEWRMTKALAQCAAELRR